MGCRLEIQLVKIVKAIRAYLRQRKLKLLELQGGVNNGFVGFARTGNGVGVAIKVFRRKVKRVDQVGGENGWSGVAAGAFHQQAIVVGHIA